MTLFAYLLRRLLRIGTLIIIDADGKTHRFGSDTEPSVAIRFHDAALPRRLLWNPHLYFGEAYTDGALTMESGSIYDLLGLLARNFEVTGTAVLLQFFSSVFRFLQFLQQHNPMRRARANASHHYDRPDEIFDAFLDPDRHYSCAYFRDMDDSLEAAQANKVQHIAAKLLVKPGMRILDIGSGWGGLALWLARECGAKVTGITLAERQLAFAEQRAKETGLSAQFFLRDYRGEAGEYDRIVSVGMFEHVGKPHYGAFFTKIRDLLTEDGVALIHSIGRSQGPGTTSPWIRKYIFPGAYVPALSEVTAAVEKTGLWITDIEILRLHYAETLREWRRRFLANRERVAGLCGESFCRMWEFYLAASEVAFRYGGMMVMQIQIGRRQDAVPLVRDYIVDGERMWTSDTAAAAE